MKKIVVFVILILLACMWGTAVNYQHKTAGLSIWFPDNWKVNADEDILAADAPGGDAFAQLMILPDADSLNTAVDALVKELDPIIKGFTMTNTGEEIKINGLIFFVVEGEGKVDGVRMGVLLAMIATQKGKVGMLTMFCPHAFFKKYESDFVKIIQSIKPI